MIVQNVLSYPTNTIFIINKHIHDPFENFTMLPDTLKCKIMPSIPINKVNGGELARRGHRLDFYVAETYGEEERSILMIAELWTRNVSAYIGPQETCVHEGRMAAAFNLPMISYVSFVFMNTSNFDVYEGPTVARTILSSLANAGVELNSVSCWDESYRVVEQHLNNPFDKIIAETHRETRRQYWVVGVNTETYNDREPDVYVRGLLKKYPDSRSLRILRSYFSVIGSAPIGYLSFANRVDEYRQRPPFNFKNPLKSFKEEGHVQAVPETAYLYDAVHIYAESLVRALDEGRDPRDGKKIISSLYGLHYRSAMGYMVYMDENGDPEGNYTLIGLDYQSSKGYGLYPIANFVGKENNTNLPVRFFTNFPIFYFPLYRFKPYYGYVQLLRVIQSIPWVDGRPPVAEPYCGYHGEKCYSHTGEIIGGVAGGLLLVAGAVLLVVYRNWRYEQELDSLLWKVNYKDIEIKDAKDAESATNGTAATAGADQQQLLKCNNFSSRSSIDECTSRKMKFTTSLIVVLLGLSCFCSVSQAAVSETSVNHKFPGKTFTASSDSPAQNSTIVYASCSLENEQALSADCELVAETLLPDDQSQGQMCRVKLGGSPDKREHILIESLQVVWLARRRALVGWLATASQGRANQYVLRGLIVDMPSCRQRETPNFVNTFGGHERRYAVTDRGFNVLYSGPDLTLATVAFDDAGRRSDYYSLARGPKDLGTLESKFFPIEGGNGGFLLLQSDFNADVQVSVVAPNGKCIISNFTSIIAFENRIDIRMAFPATKKTLAEYKEAYGYNKPGVDYTVGSTAHQRIGYCVHSHERMTHCAQHDLQGKQLSQTVLPFDYNIYGTAMHNLRQGGFLLLTTRCDEATFMATKCDLDNLPKDNKAEIERVVKNGSSHEISKVDAEGRIVGSFRAPRFQCGLTAHLVRAQFYEQQDGKGHCLVVVCQSKYEGFEGLRAKRICFDDRDFVPQ
ncbi:unnamed protein product [Trichogramma brassicae]|uniref:Uncharacterized protein n=1 Tax=Trichogramma brassicae TaxID=86971 RepID=A0A6H5IJS4_9HYME|nr:unnamed protein product [Trichogramma brassicae]